MSVTNTKATTSPNPTQESVFEEGGGLGEGTPFGKKGFPPPGSPSSITTLTIVGARGGMGKLIAARSRAAGLTVRDLDRPLTGEKIRAAVDGADMVLVSVPVYATAEVAGQLAPWLNGRQILADVGSVKMLPIAGPA